MKSRKGIIYTTISRKGVVLVEEVNRSPAFTHSGNFSQIVHILISKLPTDGNHSYHYDKKDILLDMICSEFDISIYNRCSLSYIALSHRQIPVRTIFNYLHAVSEEFLSLFGSYFYGELIAREASLGAQPFCFTPFAASLNVLMNRYNNPGKDAAGRVLEQMDEVKDVMISNIDKVLQRGEKLELVIDKTGELAQTATLFQRDSNRLKRRTILENWKLYGIIVIIILIVIALVTIPFLLKSKKK